MLGSPLLVITQEMLRLISGIDVFKGSWKFWGTMSPERLQTLRHVATIESIGSSTRIEGSKLSDQEVEVLISRLKNQSFRSRDEQEVAGYGFVSEEIFQRWEAMPFTENVIKQLHSWLLHYSDKDERHRGEYKKVTNSVEAFGEDGKSLGIIFETATPFETPARMQELVSWTRENLETHAEIHPLLVIGIFIVVFLAIHPFQDGNGRLSRILTTLLLLKAGYAYVPYSSLERIVEENKESYYVALRRTQQSLKNQEPSWEPWLMFFLQILSKQKECLERKILREKLIQEELLQLSAISAQILVLVKEHGRISINELTVLIDANANTIKAHVQKMVKNNLLLKHGKGRATWYTVGLFQPFTD